MRKHDLELIKSLWQAIEDYVAPNVTLDTLISAARFQSKWIRRYGSEFFDDFLSFFTIELLSLPHVNEPISCAEIRRAAERAKYQVTRAIKSVPALGSLTDNLIPVRETESEQERSLRLSEFKVLLTNALRSFELLILGMYMEGLSSSDIAVRLLRNEKSIRNMRARMFARLRSVLPSYLEPP